MRELLEGTAGGEVGEGRAEERLVGKVSVQSKAGSGECKWRDTGVRGSSACARACKAAIPMRDLMTTRRRCVVDGGGSDGCGACSVA